MKIKALWILSIVLILMILSSCIPLVDVITLEQKNMTTGRVYYIKATYTQGFAPVSGAVLKFQYFDGSTWQDIRDAITGDTYFTTDSNGEAQISVLPIKSGTLKIRAVLQNDPDVYGEAQMSVSKTNWGILLFMIADNNLEDFAWEDYQETLNTNPDVFVISILDTTNYGDYIRVMDENGEWVNAPISSPGGGDINTGDPVWLSAALSFLYGVESNYKGLILWDHGSAWMYDSQVMSDDEPQPRIIGYDETSEDGLSIAEVREAIEDAFGSEKLDFLGMDACLMSSLEVAYELRNNARYFMASAFTEPGTGWDYSFLSYISSTTDPIMLGKLVIDGYFSSTDEQPLSLAMWDMSEIYNVAQAVSSLGFRLVDLMDDYLANRILGYLDYDVVHYGEGDYYSLVDIWDFAKAISNGESDPQLIQRANQVLSSLNSALIYGKMSPNLGSIGMSVFFPDSASDWNYFVDDLNTLLFYTDDAVSGWGYFLYNFLAELIY